MNREIKIQSVSDIITNSSTEVFMVYDDSAFKNIKELVNAILALAGSDQTFDDLFEIKAGVDEYFIEQHPEYANLPEDALIEKAREIDSERYDGYPYISYYKVTAKEAKNTATAKILSKIDEIFNTYARYC